MREYVRLIKMKVVNDIRIVQRLLKNQVVVVRPARSRRNDRERRRALPNRRRQLHLHAQPTIAIRKLRLIHNFEKDAVRIQSDAE